MLIGYARVSTQEQENHLQTDALRSAGVTKIHEEKRSGGNMRRPVLEALLCDLRPGHTVVVYKTDRMARSLRDLLHIIERIDAAGALFRSLTEPMDTSSPAGRMILQIVGSFAEFERALIRERTKVGIDAAIRRGVVMGRPRKLSEQAEADILRRWRGQTMTRTAMARMHGVHLSTIKRTLRRDRGELALPR